MKKNSVKTCPQCGKSFVGYKNQICCSIKCGANNRKPKINQPSLKEETGRKFHCPYQETVRCAVRKCDKCGWNPDVAKARTEAYEKSGRKRNDL